MPQKPSNPLRPQRDALLTAPMHAPSRMSNQAINPQDLARRESEIELLARETDMPVENVHAIYNSSTRNSNR